jgi:hypothetical protein
VSPSLKTIDADTNVRGLIKVKLPLFLPESWSVVDTLEVDVTLKKTGIFTSGVYFGFLIGSWICWSKRVKLLAIPIIPVKRLRPFEGNCLCML